MELYLQMGFGMMEHAKTLISSWGSGTCILSPRDMTVDQMDKFCREIKSIGGKIALDPQFYQPYSDHEKLINHSFWPNDFETGSFFSGSAINDMVDILWNEYNSKYQADTFFIPGRYSGAIDDDWKKYNDQMIDVVTKKSIGIPRYASLALSSEVVISEDQVHDILDHVEDWPVDGFYLVARHSKDDYLVPDASWLAGLIDLCAGLKLLGKKVIVGYSSQQMVYLALAKVDAIASGTWVNVRTFSLDKFEAAEDDQQSRRTTWYYCPQSLSEYQITFLDIAKRAGVLNDIKTDDSFRSEYVNVLFSGAQPTTVGISEREAFRHYLHCLKMQTGYASQASYEDTYKYLNMLFNTAGQLANYFKTKGVRAKYRDFSEVMDDTIAAIDLFNTTRGMIYKHRWNSI